MTLEGLLKYPAALLLALLVTYILTPFCQKAATTLGIVDRPGARRLNTTAIPRGGGLAVFAGLHIACLAIFSYSASGAFSGSINMQWWLTLLTASSILLIVGLFDDALEINWFMKLGGQLIAALIMYQGGINFGSIQGTPLPEWLNMILTVGWFLAFINAFNLIDGLDGLACGLAAIAAAGLAVTTIYRNMPTDALLLLALTGACIGFLRYNFHPAKIFLGDSGSMVIGFTLAAIGLEGASKSTAIVAIGVPFLAIGVPVFDVMLAIWRRSLKAMVSKDGVVGKVVQADMEHLHHRLLKSGVTQRKVALTLYAINGLLVSFGVLTVVFNSRATGIFLLAIVVASYIVVKHLAQLELWDSGSALLSGMRRPGKRMLPAILYPIVDATLLLLSLALAVALVIPAETLSEYRANLSMRIPVWCGVPFILLGLTGIYTRVWSRARASEFGLLGLTLIGAYALCLAVRMIVDPNNAARSLLIGITHGGMSTVLILGIRTLPRLIQDMMAFSVNPRNEATNGGTLIFGAGSRGLLYLRRKTYRADQEDQAPKILGFLDDDTGLRKRSVHGYKVHGCWEERVKIVEDLKPSEIVVTCTLEKHRMEQLTKLCATYNIRLVEWTVGEKVLNATVPLRASIETSVLRDTPTVPAPTRPHQAPNKESPSPKTK